ncbi:ABC transporter ATP-binding protein [Caldifermentibacillus hisashii]|uniref:ABC transporter ATP-binding protein n=1 Tax=Caldifermentibacillus hisashii TaxID=996558 RepID=UPI003D1E3B46
MSLELKNITKEFNKKIAVHNLNLTVPTGEVFGFLGANGAGKTTTFRMILDLIKPTSGTIYWNGKPINYKIKNRIGYLPEERGLYPNMTIEEEILYFGRLKKMNRTEIVSEIKYWLDRFEITENIKKKKVGSLSKGNQQKIQLITAIINKPDLLILDEPFSGLDPVNVEMLKSAVKDLQKNGTTIVFSSHRMDHVEELCENICIMKHGQPVVSGKIKDIKNNFGKKYVVIHGLIDDSKIASLSGVKDVQKNKNGITLSIESKETARKIFSYIKEMDFVEKFSVEDPSLQEIFIAKVGGKNG